MMIKLRTKFLHSILKVSPSAGFNRQLSSPDEIEISDDLADEMKAVLNSILQKGTSDSGRIVDYSKIKTLPEYAAYQQLADQLASFNLSQLKTREEKLAFWINLYNALVIDAVIRENVKESVTESQLGVLAFFQNAAYWINNQRFSLDDIEHGVLRANQGFPYFPGKQFSSSDPRQEAVIHPMDPRIHFALNCASISCPPIAFYSAGQIDSQLNLASRSFVQQDLKIDPKRNTILISRIFSWYRTDFGGKAGILHFLVDHLDDLDTISWINSNRNKVRIQHKEYDWRLNKIKK
jgi:hypothetical protein